MAVTPELLKFKKGLHSALPSTYEAGTIYVTTDEKAMYVDISDTDRIRLGQIVNFETLAKFQEFLQTTNPPYSQEAFYYIEDKNALLRWKASTGSTTVGGSETAGTWVQINSVSDVQANLTNLTTRVSNLETEQITQNEAIDAVEAAIGTASKGTGDGTEGNDAATGLHALIEANEAAAAAAQAKANANAGEISTLKTDKLDVSTFNTFKTDNTAAIKAVSDKVGTSADEANTKTAFERIEALETSDAGKASAADVKKLNTTVYGSADGTETDTGLTKKVAALKTNSATKAELKEATDDIAENATAIKNVSDNLGISTASAGTGTAFARIKKLEEAIGDGTGLDGRLDAVEGILGDSTEGLVKDVEDLQAALGDKESPADGSIYKEIADIKVKDGQQDTSIANLEKVLNGDSSATDQDAKDGVLKRLSAVEDQADATDEEIGTKDASITETTLWDAIKANKDAAAANAGAIGDANSGLTKKVNDNTNGIQTNATNITNLTNAIGDKTDINGTVDGVTTDTVYGAINKNAAAIESLEDTLLAKIKAANEMTYQGGVKAYNELPTLNVQVGDTYIATEAFTYTVGDDTVQVYAGDLLIASGTEDDDLFIKENLTWTVVNTGYIDEHEAQLGVTPTAENVDAAINLTSHVAGAGVFGDLGKVTFTSDNLAITSTYDESKKAGNININAIWGSF